MTARALRSSSIARWARARLIHAKAEETTRMPSVPSRTSLWRTRSRTQPTVTCGPGGRKRAAGSAVLPCRAMTTRTIRVGFIGAGANSRLHHVPKLGTQAGLELVAVANRSRESGERIAKEFGIARVHDDWRELIQARDIDAICIGTWPSTHCEMTVAALEAGKHVLCEARMAMNATEGRRMLAAARQRPDLIAQLVPAPNSLEVDETLRSRLAEGYVGDVLALELHSTQARFVDRDAPLHWRQDIELSGPNTLNMGIWYEALMRWLGPARRVMALTRVNVSQRRDASGAWRAVK